MRWPQGKMATCPETCPESLEQKGEDEPATPTVQNPPHSVERDFDFVEKPPQDFFCPVSLDFLLEPQLTFCCGHHLSLEAANRLQREGKPCPMCNSEEWSAVLDKYHRRRVHEVRVRCWYAEDGCEWVGEVNALRRHSDSCGKRPWECRYCAVKCKLEEGGENHWPTCAKFPEPCPNSCEVGSVERCNLEQHRSECSLEPVACEMKEFGCRVMVPRKELARHMRESERQHLTAMTMLNLRLSLDRDKKIEQLQQKVCELQQEICELKEVQAEQKEELTELKDCVYEVQRASGHIEQHIAPCSSAKVFTFKKYAANKFKAKYVKIAEDDSFSDLFFSHQNGYAFKLEIRRYYSQAHNDIGAFLCLKTGENDDLLQWPMRINVKLELLNQAGDHNHVIRNIIQKWEKCEIGETKDIDNSLMKYSDLERRRIGVQYMRNDQLKFRIHVHILTT